MRKVYSLHFTSLRTPKSDKLELVDLLERNIAKRQKNPDIELATVLDLHTKRSPALARLNAKILDFSRGILDADCTIVMQWGLLIPPYPLNDIYPPLWHHHDSDLSVVYYLVVPKGLPHPQARFAFKVPSVQHIDVKEGMLIGFHKNMLHDGIKHWDGTETRMVIAADLDARHDPVDPAERREV